MSNGQWEVVSNKSKHKNQGSNGKNKISKGQKKKLRENMPRLEEMPPIKESQTMFQVFLETDGKQEHAKTNGVMESKGKKNSVQQKKKTQDKKKGHETSKLSSFDIALSKLTLQDVQPICSDLQARFPDAPSIWLKDLVSFLNIKLTGEVADLQFCDKPNGYPFSELHSDVQDFLISTINSCSVPVLTLFFEFCLQSMVQDMGKGLSTFGYRIFLQCLAQQKPEVVMTNLAKCNEVRSSCQNRQNICLSVMWAVGQVGIHDLKYGLKAWRLLMFPVLGMRAYTKYIIEYLQNILNLHPKVNSASEVFGVRELFPILDFVYIPSGIPGTSQKQLQALYPQLKALSYGPNPESVFHNYFPSYLRRLKSTCHPSFKQELLTSLVECLTLDRQCYSTWRQLYTKHLVQSSQLLGYLSQQWEHLPSSFPRKLLKETLSTFRVTNEELSAQHKTGQDGLTDCTKYCTELLSRMNEWKFPWRHLIILLCLAVSALLAYDIHIHGSFKTSKTGNALKEIGMLAVCEQAWSRVTVYSGKMYQWLELNVPVYYSKVCHVCKPYVQLFWEKLFLLCIYLWDSTQWFRDWFSVAVPPLLQWCNDIFPVYMERLIVSIFEVCKILQSYSVWIWSYVSYYLGIIGTWLAENVFTGSLSPANIQRYVGNVVEILQKYTISTYHWVSQQIFTIASSTK